jgi:hypothetical protein
MLMASGQRLPSASIRDWCKRWLASSSLEAEPRTHERYETSIKRFLLFLGQRADEDLDTLKVSDVLGFRDEVAKRLSTTSTNMDLKILRACLHAAQRQELLHRQRLGVGCVFSFVAFRSVKPFYANGGSRRRFPCALGQQHDRQGGWILPGTRTQAKMPFLKLPIRTGAAHNLADKTLNDRHVYSSLSFHTTITNGSGGMARGLFSQPESTITHRIKPKHRHPLLRFSPILF